MIKKLKCSIIIAIVITIILQLCFPIIVSADISLPNETFTLDRSTDRLLTLTDPRDDLNVFEDDDGIWWYENLLSKWTIKIEGELVWGTDPDNTATPNPTPAPSQFPFTFPENENAVYYDVKVTITNNSKTAPIENWVLDYVYPNKNIYNLTDAQIVNHTGINCLASTSIPPTLFPMDHLNSLDSGITNGLNGLNPGLLTLHKMIGCTSDNSVIDPLESVSFSYIAEYDETTMPGEMVPYNINSSGDGINQVIQRPVNVKSHFAPQTIVLRKNREQISSYNYEYNITRKPASSRVVVNAKLTISNTSSEDIELPEIEFTLNYPLFGSVSDYNIYTNSNGITTIKPLYTNTERSTLHAGESIAFSFSYKLPSVSSNPDAVISNIRLSGVKYITPPKTDTDNEGLKDALEILINSNPYVSDTDGDRLSDYVEFAQTYTDPCLTDSDYDGINDYYEDSDEDGINNGDEITLYNTNPGVEDTDDDGLSDYEELFVYSTNPNSVDTDHDGLIDGLEIEKEYTNVLGQTKHFDPNNAYTLCAVGVCDHPTSDHSNCPQDGKIKFETEVYAEDVPEDAYINASASLSLTGDGLDDISVSRVSKNHPYLNAFIPGFIDNAYSFETEGEFDEAMISFEFDASLFDLYDGFIPAIYHWSEEAQCLELVEQATMDPNTGLPDTTSAGSNTTYNLETDTYTITVSVTHFSEYMLIDRNLQDEAQSGAYEILHPYGDDGVYDVIFVLDKSGSMADNVDGGNMSRLNVSKELICDFIDDIESDHTRFGLVTFNRSASYVCPLTTNKTTVKSAVNGVVSGGGTAIYSGLNCATNNYSSAPAHTGCDLEHEKIIVLLTDGDDDPEVDNSNYFGPNGVVNKAINQNIRIFTIGLAMANEDLLRRIASTTGAEYRYANNTEESMIEMFDNIFILVNRTDSDGDGLMDYYEQKITEGSLRFGNGAFLIGDASATNMVATADTDGDGLLDGDELEVIYNENTGAVYAIMHSNPLKADSDDDGLLDGKDDEPLMSINPDNTETFNYISNPNAERNVMIKMLLEYTNITSNTLDRLSDDQLSALLTISIERLSLLSDSGLTDDSTNGDSLFLKILSKVLNKLSGVSKIWYDNYAEGELLALLQVPNLVFSSITADNYTDFIQIAAAATGTAARIWESVGSNAAVISLLRVPSGALLTFKSIIDLYGPDGVYDRIKDFKFGYSNLVYNCYANPYFYKAVIAIGYNHPYETSEWSFHDVVQSSFPQFAEYISNTLDQPVPKLCSWNELDTTQQEWIVDSMDCWDSKTNVASVINELTGFLNGFIHAYNPGL